MEQFRGMKFEEVIFREMKLLDFFPPIHHLQTKGMTAPIPEVIIIKPANTLEKS